MIREANKSDADVILAMGERFIRETEYAKKIRGNVEAMKRFIGSMLDGNGKLFILERNGAACGMIGILIYEHPYSGEKTAVETFWWVNPENRGGGLRLLEHAEDYAREAGAKSIQMIAPNDGVARLYKHLGYEYVESTYQRAL